MGYKPRKTLLEGWLGWFLNIHTPSAHVTETCWCIGTKRQLFPEDFPTKSRALESMDSYYRYISEISRGKE